VSLSEGFSPGAAYASAMAEPAQLRVPTWYRRSLVLAMLAVLFVPAVSGALWAQQARSATASAPSRGPSPPAPSREVQSGAPAAPSTTAVLDLLRRRGAAVASRDRAAWLATVDRAVPGLEQRQGDLFDRLVQLRPASWAYSLLPPDAPLPAGRRAALGRSAVLAHVRLTYRLAPDAEDIERDQHLTLVWRGRWLVGGTDDGPQQRDLWDMRPITVSRGSRSIVVAARSGPVPAPRTAAEADAAAQRVDAVWGASWPRTVLVLAPATLADMGTILDRPNPDGLSELAAVTTGELRTPGTGDVVGGRTSGDRVIVNPLAFPALTATGRGVVLTHEFTHVATRSAVRTPPPVWVDEGFADYVAYLGAPLSVHEIAGDLLDSSTALASLRKLPSDRDFDPTGGPVGVAYAEAWLAMRFIEDQGGTSMVVDFYRVAAGLKPLHSWPRLSPPRPSLAPKTALEHACLDIVGYIEPSFARRWVVYVRAQSAT
jgi:hypothetical protein